MRNNLKFKVKIILIYHNLHTTKGIETKIVIREFANDTKNDEFVRSVEGIVKMHRANRAIDDFDWWVMSPNEDPKSLEPGV